MALTMLLGGVSGGVSQTVSIGPGDPGQTLTVKWQETAWGRKVVHPKATQASYWFRVYGDYDGTPWYYRTVYVMVPDGTGYLFVQGGADTGPQDCATDWLVHEFNWAEFRIEQGVWFDSHTPDGTFLPLPQAPAYFWPNRLPHLEVGPATWYFGPARSVADDRAIADMVFIRALSGEEVVDQTGYFGADYYCEEGEQ